MEFRIADTFTDSLAKLTGQEQKAVKTTAFDLQMNPAQPGMSFHKLDRAKDPNFWSVRVSRDIRIIVHRTDESLMLCYVDHHDAAYSWAERRKLEVHPNTGAAQLVEIRETVREVTIPVYVEAEQPAPPKPLLFDEVTDEQLLNYGVRRNGCRMFVKQPKTLFWNWLITSRRKLQKRSWIWQPASLRMLLNRWQPVKIRLIIPTLSAVSG